MAGSRSIGSGRPKRAGVGAPNDASPRATRHRLGLATYSLPATDVCTALLGSILVRHTAGGVRRARVMEVEAYLGPKDLASHSSKGRTQRTEVMFGPPGRAYVYFIYGMHYMFNVVAGVEGQAHAVLVRAGQPLDGWEADLTGPGKLARAFDVTRSDYGCDLTGDDFYFVADHEYQPRVMRTKRIGVDYARQWKDRLLRYIDVNNPVSARLKR